jgi:hypothetical protein
MAARRGRSSKYTPELVEEIVTAIAVHGVDAAGWDGRISKDTFYEWLKHKPDFSDMVVEAKNDYRRSLPETKRRQANLAFSQYLYGEMERVIVTTERGHSQKGGDYECETIKRIPVGVPKWAIDRVLGANMSEIEALSVLVQAGWLPRGILNVAIAEVDKLKTTLQQVFAGILPDKGIDAKPGLSEEMAAEIRMKILGIQPQEESLRSLSDEDAIAKLFDQLAKVGLADLDMAALKPKDQIQALKTLLDKFFDIDLAIQRLDRLGFDVTPRAVLETVQHQAGLTEAVAGEIRSRILGIESSSTPMDS